MSYFIVEYKGNFGTSYGQRVGPDYYIETWTAIQSNAFGFLTLKNAKEAIFTTKQNRPKLSLNRFTVIEVNPQHPNSKNTANRKDVGDAWDRSMKGL